MIESLKPGDYISPDVLEHELGKFVDNVKMPMKRTDPGYRQALLRLRTRIETERKDLICRTELDGIRVLPESERSAYSATARRRALNSLGRACMINARTNRSVLSLEDSNRLDHETRVNSGVSAAAHKVAQRLDVGLLLAAEAKRKQGK